MGWSKNKTRKKHKYAYVMDIAEYVQEHGKIIDISYEKCYNPPCYCEWCGAEIYYVWTLVFEDGTELHVGSVCAKYFIRYSSYSEEQLEKAIRYFKLYTALEELGAVEPRYKIYLKELDRIVEEVKEKKEIIREYEKYEKALKDYEEVEEYLPEINFANVRWVFLSHWEREFIRSCFFGLTEKMKNKLEEVNKKIENITIEENLEHVYAQWFMWFIFYYKEEGLLKLRVSPRVEQILGDIWDRRKAHSMWYFYPFSRKELDFIWRQINYNYVRSREFRIFIENLSSLIENGYFWSEEITVWHRMQKIPVLFVLWNEIECPSVPCRIINIFQQSIAFTPWIVFYAYIYDKYWWWSNEYKQIIVRAIDDENFLPLLIEATENLIEKRIT